MKVNQTQNCSETQKFQDFFLGHYEDRNIYLSINIYYIFILNRKLLIRTLQGPIFKVQLCFFRSATVLIAKPFFFN